MAVAMALSCTVTHCPLQRWGGAHFAVCGVRISWGACSAHLKRFFNVHSRVAALELWSAAVRIEKALQMRTERAPGNAATFCGVCTHRKMWHAHFPGARSRPGRPPAPQSILTQPLFRPSPC